MTQKPLLLLQRFNNFGRREPHNSSYLFELFTSRDWCNTAGHATPKSHLPKTKRHLMNGTRVRIVLRQNTYIRECSYLSLRSSQHIWEELIVGLGFPFPVSRFLVPLFSDPRLQQCVSSVLAFEIPHTEVYVDVQPLLNWLPCCIGTNLRRSGCWAVFWQHKTKHSSTAERCSFRPRTVFSHISAISIIYSGLIKSWPDITERMISHNGAGSWWNDVRISLGLGVTLTPN